MESKEIVLPEKLLIHGGKKLNGTINVQGAKNSALPVIACASLLRGETLTLDCVPHLYDIYTMKQLLESFGAQIDFNNNLMKIYVPEEISYNAPIDLVRKMRASSIALGPLTTRVGKCVLPLPGGCDLGDRPLDFHLKALTKMGAEVELSNGAIITSVKGRLKCANIRFDFPSVGATQNIMMAASLADGTTYIDNAAKEPEIVNLADTLRLMGADIKGDGTETIRVIGTEKLHSAQNTIMPDRIEAITYLLAGVMTEGAVSVRGIDAKLFSAVLDKMTEAGVSIDIFKDEITAKYVAPLKHTTIKTMPFPGFPTDAQPQFMAFLTKAKGISIVEESIFNNRLNHIDDFNAMGADVRVSDNIAYVTGVESLHGASVHSFNLRAGAAMIMMGLAAKGDTIVSDLKHVWRGYENLVPKLRSLGADLEFVE